MTLSHERYVSKPRKVPEVCPPAVRIARKSDAKALFDLIMTGVAPEMAVAPVNEQRVAGLVHDVLQPVMPANIPRPVVAVIDGEGGRLAAAAPIIPKQWWYSDEWHLVQPWIYVCEQYRKQPFARTLIETVTWWSERVHLPMLMVTSATDELADRRQVYARYAKPFGGSFIHTGGNGKPTVKPLNVRVASPRDYLEVRELCMLLNTENASAALNPQRLEEVLAVTLSQSRGIIAVATDESGKIVGCVCLAQDQWDYSMAWHYSEVWVFVHPEHRKGGYAADLLNFSKWWAEQTGIPVTIGITSQHRTQAKMRLYERHLKPLEAFFLHDTRGGASDGQENKLDH